MRWRPQVSGVESPMDPKVDSPAGGAKAPRVSASAGSSEKRPGVRSHASSYSNRIVSIPRTRLLLATLTDRVWPFRSICTAEFFIKPFFNPGIVQATQSSVLRSFRSASLFTTYSIAIDRDGKTKVLPECFMLIVLSEQTAFLQNRHDMLNKKIKLSGKRLKQNKTI